MVAYVWYSETPTTRIGAASPIARESARMIPVRAPGSAIGSRWLQITSHFVAPSAYPPSLMEPGMARSASLVATMMTGRIEQTQRQRAGEHASATGDRRQKLHEDAEAEQAVDHRRHPGEVGDVDLDYPVDARVLSVLFEVNGGPEP